MGKVFRFHQGADTIEHWQETSIYGSTAIDAIQDPAGATERREITSIPSPFARIDLVKTAFETISKSGELEGKTIFHKMVSDCFDVAEIFFNIEKLQDKVSIITWDKENDLSKLLKSPSSKHRLLGETLNLYLKQDAKAYNFNATQRLFLLNYKGPEGPNSINIIGGTSPASLFFTSANNLDFVKIQFGNDIVFDKNFQPLYKREFPFFKFIYGFKKFMPNFTTLFRAVDDYIESNYKHLTGEQKDILNNYTLAEYENEFARLNASSEGSVVDILGFALRKKADNGLSIRDSGFRIGSSKFLGEKPPLVLPVDDFAEQIKYTTDFWNRNNKVDYEDPRPMSVRTLPFDGAKYPYLTISDFLEPYIIRTIYPINKSKFFDGNLSAAGDITRGFILPVKREYFDYFNTETLMGVTADGKKNFEIKLTAGGGLIVVLRVPIEKGKYITYERTYYPPVNDFQVAEPEIERNRGAIIENQFGLAVYPFFKHADANHYRVSLIDRDVKEHLQHNAFNLRFYKNQTTSALTPKGVSRRSLKETEGVTSDHYVLEDSFDYIEVSNNWTKGILIPNFPKFSQGTSQFSFAIDFGTTNTHVEYRKDNGPAIPLEVNDDDVQLGTLHDLKNPETLKSINALRANKILDIILHELMPEIINSNHEYQFPLRTSIVANKTLDINQQTYALADLNIPFVYEKYPITTNSRVRTNLKWSDYVTSPNEVKIIEAFFETLMFIIRNKVILNGGDLNRTKLIWLYPSSMTKFRIDYLERTWNSVFRKYINTTIFPEKISESIAPFYYFNTQLGVNALSSSVVSIDIGGGTTDVVIYTNNRPEILTSFKFAANSIFGDAFNRSTTINGFVQTFTDQFTSLLKQNGQNDLIKILNHMQEAGRSEDIAAFFFSIERNKKIKDSNIPISFSNTLMLNSDFKIMFVIFYTAIIYHVAKLMKASGVGTPKYITFSGTGSKVIKIADASERLNSLSTLTQIIFKEIFSDVEISKIEIKQDENPKELSCKGALNFLDSHNINVDEIKAVLLGNKDQALIPQREITYNDISPEIERSVISEYEDFITWFFNLHKKFSFKDNFGINPTHLEKYREYLTEHAMDDLKAGILEKRKELDNDFSVKIEETLFFHPLTGGLNNLAYKIYSELKEQTP